MKFILSEVGNNNVWLNTCGTLFSLHGTPGLRWTPFGKRRSSSCPVQRAKAGFKASFHVPPNGELSIDVWRLICI
jgi:hypothetical protein